MHYVVPNGFALLYNSDRTAPHEILFFPQNVITFIFTSEKRYKWIFSVMETDPTFSES